jgi:hypothetical protein
MPVNLHKPDATFDFHIPTWSRFATVYSDTTGRMVGTIIRPLVLTSDRRWAVVINGPDGRDHIKRFRFQPRPAVVNFFARSVLAPARARESV